MKEPQGSSTVSAVLRSLGNLFTGRRSARREPAAWTGLAVAPIFVRIMTLRVSLGPLVLAGLVLLVACDSDDPVRQPPKDAGGEDGGFVDGGEDAGAACVIAGCGECYAVADAPDPDDVGCPPVALDPVVNACEHAHPRACVEVTGGCGFVRERQAAYDACILSGACVKVARNGCGPVCIDALTTDAPNVPPCEDAGVTDGGTADSGLPYGEDTVCRRNLEHGCVLYMLEPTE